jgi:hypothetical protein
LEESRGHFQNEVDLLKILKVEDEHHDGFQIEVDSLKTMKKADYDRHGSM